MKRLGWAVILAGLAALAVAAGLYGVTVRQGAMLGVGHQVPGAQDIGSDHDR